MCRIVAQPSSKVFKFRPLLLRDGSGRVEPESAQGPRLPRCAQSEHVLEKLRHVERLERMLPAPQSVSDGLTPRQSL
jgi:hypothetical protein